MPNEAFPSQRNDRFRRRERQLSRARKAIEAALDGGAESYRRVDFLSRFHRLDPETIAGEMPEACQLVIRELERALRAERSRAGHWSYDLNRHIGLLVAFRAERERLARMLETQSASGRRKVQAKVRGVARTENVLENPRSSPRRNVGRSFGQGDG